MVGKDDQYFVLRFLVRMALALIAIRSVRPCSDPGSRGPASSCFADPNAGCHAHGWACGLHPAAFSAGGSMTCVVNYLMKVGDHTTPLLGYVPLTSASGADGDGVDSSRAVRLNFGLGRIRRLDSVVVGMWVTVDVALPLLSRLARTRFMPDAVDPRCVAGDVTAPDRTGRHGSAR